MTWFKRFAILGGIVIILELVAWVGIATLGPDAFRQMLAFYDPRPVVGEVVEEQRADGRVARCAVYAGEMLCIEEGEASAAEPRDAAGNAATRPLAAATGYARRCAQFNGQEICIEEGR
jgi:hypothetical protein